VSRGRKVKRHACSVIGTQQFREMEVREQRSKGTLLKTTKRPKEKEKEKEKDQGLPSRPSQMAAEERSYTSAQRRALMTADIELGDVGRGVLLVIRAAGEPNPPPAGDGGIQSRVWH